MPGSLWHAIDAWICPPPLPGCEHGAEEINRLRIARALLPILFITFWAIAILNRTGPDSLALDLARAGIEVGVISVICLTLSHWRHSQASAWVYVLVFCVFSTAIILTEANLQPAGKFTLLMYGPILLASMLLGAWSGVSIALFMMAMLALRALLRIGGLEAPEEVLINCFSICVGVGMIYLFMRGLHHALRNGDQTKQIAALNQDLQAALQESEKLLTEFGTVFEAVQDGLVVVDQDGRELHRNSAALRLMGNMTHGLALDDAGEFLQITALDGTPIKPQQMAMARVLRGETPDPPTPYRFRRYDDVRFIAEMTATPLHDAKRELVGALAVIHDITSEYNNERRSDIMREVAHACACAADAAAVAQAAITALCDGLGIPTGYIFTRDPERTDHLQALHIRRSAKVPAPAYEEAVHLITNLPIAPDAVIATLRVIATGEPIFDFQPDYVTAEGNKQSMFGPGCYIPLRWNNEVVGVLGLVYDSDQRDVWEAFDSDLLLTVAEEVATSLHRARLYEDAQRLALFDPLTGLRNQRALRQALDQEMQQAESQLTSLSVIMLDVDHFRRFNEDYGHDVGDMALRAVADAIQSAIRRTDCAARYGGEEFTVIMPATDASEAHLIAERVRQSIAAHQITVAGQEPVSISASVGYATYPMHGTAPTALLKAADQALYAAKHGGRNRVVGFTNALRDEAARAA